MERLGCECAIPSYCFTHYLEPGYKEENIRIETCEAVTEKKEDTGSLIFKVFPEIEAACIYHKGSYDTFPQSYAVILKYIEDNDYEICGNIREQYIDGVWNKDSESEWLSEIQIPVKKSKKNEVFVWKENWCYNMQRTEIPDRSAAFLNGFAENS